MHIMCAYIFTSMNTEYFLVQIAHKLVATKEISIQNVENSYKVPD
jgi:hypothetical protein